MAKGIGQGRTVTCTSCGETGLRWDNAYRESTIDRNNPKGIYRLWNPSNGRVHACATWERKLASQPGGLLPAVKPTTTAVNGNTSFKIIESVEPDDYEPTDYNSYPTPDYADTPTATAMVQAIQSSGLNRAEVEKMIADAGFDIYTDLRSGDGSNRALIEANNRIVLEALASVRAEIKSTRKIELVQAGETRILDDRQHKTFPELLEYVNLGFNVLLVGPAGGGKTTAAEKTAEALNLPFYLFPMGPAVTESRLLGWMDANGKLVRTLFRDAYENGGIFMADEMDNCNASALTTLNGALANGMVGFPDGMIKRHANFRFVGGANTYGRGADRMYVGRQQLDAATLDRFLVVDWEYDQSFELYLAGDDMREWVEYVWRVREAAQDNKLRVLVTPRASIDGARMLRAGISRSRVEATRLWAGMPQDAVNTIKRNL